jgi:hypothetical protein
LNETLPNETNKDLGKSEDATKDLEAKKVETLESAGIKPKDSVLKKTLEEEKSDYNQKITETEPTSKDK